LYRYRAAAAAAGQCSVPTTTKRDGGGSGDFIFQKATVLYCLVGMLTALAPDRVRLTLNHRREDVVIFPYGRHESTKNISVVLIRRMRTPPYTIPK